MKPWRVIVSDRARQVIDQQVDYIARDAVAHALAWQDRLDKAFGELAIMHGHAVDMAASRRMKSEVRKAVFERTYLIFYQVDPATETVMVIFFRHGARRPRRGEP